jgi:predicted phosphodiesterase
MKIAVLADIHANYPALIAALCSIRSGDCDRVISIGDAISIGPFPGETLQLAFSEGVEFTLGNHEEYLLKGFPTLRSAYIKEGEIEHQKWTSLQIPDLFKQKLSLCPYEVRIQNDGNSIRLLHYAFDDQGILENHPMKTDRDVEGLFGTEWDLVVFGHTHVELDQTYKTRYMNPGSLGCSRDSLARFLIIDITDGQLTVQKQQVCYEKEITLRAFEERMVPARQEILRYFFGK